MTTHIKTLLQPFFQSNDQPWKVQLLERWPEIMGPLAHRVTIEKIYQDSITLGVYDSCWLQELYLLSATLLDTINRNLDQPRLKQVRFKLVAKKEQKTVPPKNKALQKDTPDMITLTPHQEQTIAAIKDPELRAALRAFLIRCQKEKKK